MDAKVASADVLSIAVYVQVNGEAQAISANPTRPSQWIDYTGEGTWSTLSHYVDVAPEMNIGRIYFYIMLRRGAQQAALVDNVSIEIMEQ